MKTSTRRGDLGLGKTARGGNNGSYVAHERQDGAPPPLSQRSLDRGFDTLDEKLAAMTQEISEAVERLQGDDEWHRYLDAMSRLHSYSLGNQLLIALQKPEATHVGGQGMWKSIGRQLLPAEERGSGISIFRPISGFRDRADVNGFPVLRDDGKPLRDRVVIMYSAATVYDVPQTSGTPLPEDMIAQNLSGDVPRGFEEDTDLSIGRIGYALSEEELTGGRKGSTTTNGSKRIVIKAGLPPSERVRAKMHEVGHVAAGHVNEQHYLECHTGAGGMSSSMEVEADSIGHVMLRMNSMNPNSGISQYAAGWASVQSDDPDVVKNTAAGVLRAVKTLISEHDWRNAITLERPPAEPRNSSASR